MSDSIQRIPLTVENAGGVERKAWPITQGVPFADGDLPKGAPVRVVDASGKVLPTQSSCLATWNKDLNYVKWLLVDFQADLRAGQTEKFFLEYGPGVEAVAPEQGVCVERSDERIRVDTGALRMDLRVPTRQPRPPVASFQRARDFLAGCWVKTENGWRDVFRGAPGPYLYLVDTKGQVYNSCAAAPTPRVTIEDEGPMRVCVCVRGYHATESGIRLCPFALRIHLYAGKSDVKMFHTFVFDQEPEALEFAEVGMSFPLDLGGDGLRTSFGGQEKAHWAERWEEAHFLQDSDVSYRVTRDGEPWGQGEKTRGWATLCGRAASAFVAVRDLWQQYPKGYRLSKDGIDVQFWPAECGEPLVYSTPYKEDCVFFSGLRGGPTAPAASRDEAAVRQLLEMFPTEPLNLKSFAVRDVEDVRWVEEMVDKYAPDRPASHNDTGTETGVGAAKTHEFWMRFSASPISDEEAEALSICIQNPVIAPADPAYMCATRATRDLHGGSDPRFEEIDRLLDRVTERVAIEPMRLGRRWGFWWFGHMCCSHTAGAGLAYILHYPDAIQGLRHVGPYNNEADDPCWGVWTQFLRTGRRDFFLAASGYSRAMGDVGICHAHPSKNVAGLVHYHNAHFWSGGYSPSHTLNTSLFLHYYTTGDRRMYDIALEVADWAVNNQEPAGIISCRHGRLNREFTGPLNCVTEAYVATWMPKYGDLARRSLNWLLRTQEEVGIFPVSVFTRGERGDEAVIEPTDRPLSHSGTMYPTYYEGLRHFDSPLLRETILKEADHVIARGGGGHLIELCALAYELTGDPIYAAACKRAALNYCEHALGIAELRGPSAGGLFSGIRNGEVSVCKALAARVWDRDPKGLAKGEERLKAAIKPPAPSAPPQILEKPIGVPAGYEQ
ncbi:MAG: hypothetical protein A3F84_20685 [Candidatus Handelsmanbacteria bacterium RIFCSPLOWO2_12_FULL_64_10]|uniref:Uncharacterized protein n=1 Tax=Handelsmanbacteria sp. (strain RIFCSPLOWO2_12_FULL_64_10) TaxID=1817868 RepID=A0A1F6CSU4_HANXR|nr:MAG: hypothetical protein A3F84_20685 [Candidatus Handelsmanbacteria bacterium RIFCSPLOWO2_12_FULL_64_10]